jgi:TM2 domain-containing membrane protein YozV
MSDEKALRKQRAGTAAVLSFVFCGLGHIYIGQIKKGLKMMFYSSLFLFVLILGSVMVIYEIMTGFMNPPLMLKGIFIATLGLIANSITSVYNIYDAYNMGLKD